MLLDLHDRQLHHTRRRLNRGLLLDALAQQRRPKRRLVRDLAFARLGLGAADDRPGLFFVLAVDAHGDSRANAYLVAVTVLLADELGARKNAFDLADAPFEMRLLIFSVLVLA